MKKIKASRVSGGLEIHKQLGKHLIQSQLIDYPPNRSVKGFLGLYEILFKLLAIHCLIFTSSKHRQRLEETFEYFTDMLETQNRRNIAIAGLKIWIR